MNQYMSNKLKGTVGDITLKKRIGILTNIASQFPNAIDFSFLNDTKAITKWLNKYTLSSKWTYLMHIIAAIKSDNNIIKPTTITYYNNLKESLWSKRDDETNHNVKNEKQIVSLAIDLPTRQNELREQIHELFSQYKLDYKPLTKKVFNQIVNKIEFIKSVQDLIICACYLFQPALRNDWAALHLIKKKPPTNNQNYLYIRNGNMKLFLNTFKNVKSLGPQIIDVQPELSKFMTIWLSIINHHNNDMKLSGEIGSSHNPIEYPLYYWISKFKFYYQTEEDALRRAIPNAFDRVLGSKLSINDLRHLWEMYIQSDPNYMKLTQAEKINIHKQLLHGVAIAQLYNVQD